MKAFCSKKRYEYWGRVSTRICCRVLPLKSSTFLFTYVGNGLKSRTRNTPQYPPPPPNIPETPLESSGTSQTCTQMFFSFRKSTSALVKRASEERGASGRGPTPLRLTSINPPWCLFSYECSTIFKEKIWGL